MQIIIDIPEEEYKRLVYMDMFKLRGYIEGGIVLPKEHERLIEQTRWIPVEEKLPNLDVYTGKVWQKKVLITGYLSFDDTKELFVSEVFAKNVVFNCVPNTVVIAWMPLPQPYKTESEET